MKDDAGNVVLPPSFEALGWSDGNFSVIGEFTGYRQQGSWGIINLKKEFITKADFESLVYSGGECIVARKKVSLAFSKSGCINLKGEIKIPFVYDGLRVQGLTAIVFNLTDAHYYYGLSDLTHRILIPVAYKNIRPLGTLRFAVENADNKFAIFSEEGKPVTNFSIDSLSSFYKSFAIIYQNHLQGLIGRDGVVKLETQYASIKIDKEGNVHARLPNEWFRINDKNQVIQKVLADGLKPTKGNRLIIQKGNVFGVVDYELNEVLPIQFDFLSELEDGKYLTKRNGKMGVVDKSNKTLVPFYFDSLVMEKTMYRAWNKNLGWRLLNAEGKDLAGKYYEKLLPANNLGFPTLSKGYAGMIDADGHEFIHCVFDSIGEPINGLLAVKFKGQYGIINANEDWLVAPQIFPLSVINSERYFERKPGNNFIRSFQGDIVYFTPYPLEFSSQSFTEQLPDGTKKKLNYDGAIIDEFSMPENIELLLAESEGFRGIKKDGRFGFVDQQGRLRVANRYDSIGEFHEDLAATKLIGKWGFVNSNDKIVINPNYDRPSYFKNEVAVVSRNGKFGLIGKNGKVKLALRYDEIQRQPDSKFLLIASKLQGLADKEGNVLVEPRFDSLRHASEGILIACHKGKCGAITEEGLNIIPMIYDQLEVELGARIFLAEKKSEWKTMSQLTVKP